MAKATFGLWRMLGTLRVESSVSKMISNSSEIANPTTAACAADDADTDASTARRCSLMKRNSSSACIVNCVNEAYRERDKSRQGVVANTPNLFRGGAVS